MLEPQALNRNVYAHMKYSYIKHTVACLVAATLVNVLLKLPFGFTLFIAFFFLSLFTAAHQSCHQQTDHFYLLHV